VELKTTGWRGYRPVWSGLAVLGGSQESKGFNATGSLMPVGVACRSQWGAEGDKKAVIEVVVAKAPAATYFGTLLLPIYGERPGHQNYSGIAWTQQ
jgi:hypothetical protein